MYILVKKIEEYKSTRFKNKVIPEYIIYLLFGDTPIEAQIAIGDKERDSIVLQYFNSYAFDGGIKIIRDYN